MLKKVIPIALSLCLIFSISVMAENTQGNENIPNTSSERPMRGDFDPSKMPQGDFDPSKMPEGFTPSAGEFTPPQNAGKFTPPQANESNNTATTAPKATVDTTEENQQASENGEQSEEAQGGSQQFGGQMPGGMGGFPGNMQNFNSQTQEDVPKGFLGFVKTYSTPITSVVLLGLAFIFVIFYRRKNY